MMLSLRTRLLAGIVIGTALLLSVFSVMVYTITRQAMLREFDGALYARALVLSAVVEEEESAERRMIDFEILTSPNFNALSGGFFYQIWGGDGEPLLRSSSLGGGSLDYFAGGDEKPQYRDVVLPDGTAGRAVLCRFLPTLENASVDRRDDAAKLTLALAQSTAEMSGQQRFLKWLLAVSSLCIVCLSTVVAGWVTRAGLRPVNVLAQHINAVGERNLGQRFGAEDYPAELTPICMRLNETFGRLEKSFARERQFNADVAHELRTPLAGMLSTMEVCLSRERASAEYREAVEDSLHIARRMNRMIDTLLQVWRLDAGRAVFQKETVPLGGIVSDMAKTFADKMRDKRIIFENAIGDVICRSDKGGLSMILQNILENAVEYTNPDGRIELSAARVDAGLKLSLRNTGCDLSEAEAEHVCDLFWRKNASRGDCDSHYGIGLSVVQKLARALEITVDIHVQGGVFGVSLVICD